MPFFLCGEKMIYMLQVTQATTHSTVLLQYLTYLCQRQIIYIIDLLTGSVLNPLKLLRKRSFSCKIFDILRMRSKLGTK